MFAEDQMSILELDVSTDWIVYRQGRSRLLFSIIPASGQQKLLTAPTYLGEFFLRVKNA